MLLSSGLLRRLRSSSPGCRALSTKIVATVTGPANKDALTNFTRTVAGQGAMLGGSRAMEVSGTVSIASVVYVDESADGAADAVSGLQWALQSNLSGFIVSVRPALQSNPPSVFARVTVSGADRMGILAEMADHAESRSIQVSTMRTHTDAGQYGPDGIEGTEDDEPPIYTAVCTLASHNPDVDIEWIENELYEFAEKADLNVQFERLATDA